MSITETGLTYLLLILFMVGCFGGWLLKIAVDQMRADQRREAEAKRCKEECEQSYIAECEERIKDLNRQQTMYWWLSEVKGGANK